jgi:DNA invertase Pin-like site-specific DNA recombinase
MTVAPKAYSYIRFSGPRQLKGDSLRRQTELSSKYAKEHGLTLDESLKPDKGLSAFSGKHRLKGALGQFLALVNAGEISEGSILLVESLDRLSREEITEALEQFLAIIGSGIKIITLGDNNREYTKETINSNVGELIVGLTIMSRAHEESKMKSFRVGKAWMAKREKASDGGKKLTSKAPAWLKISSDKIAYELLPERAEIIEHIYKLKLAGKGTERIARELNQDKELKWTPKSPRKGGQSGWRGSYIEKILHMRAVIGEFQPHRLIEGKRQPVGEPWKGYYPAAISEQLFYQVQQQIRENSKVYEKGNGGRGGRNGAVSNLFGYIATCGYCGYPMAYVNKGEWRYLVCDQAQRKIGCQYLSVRYQEFEETVLTYCRGLDPAELLPGREEVESHIRLLQSQLSITKAKLGEVARKTGNLTDAIAEADDKRTRDLLRGKLKVALDEKESLEKETEGLKRELESASRAAEGTRERLESLSQLFDVMQTADEKQRIDIRLRLRQELRRLISRLDVYPGGRPLFTPERAQKALEDMAIVCPVGTEDYRRIEEQVHKMTENPKDFLSFSIHFATGSKRTLHPRQQPVLTTEWDKEAGVLRGWYLGPDGQVESEEYAKK